MYVDPVDVIRDNHYHARHSFTRKFCGCMALRGGCAMVCAFWAVGITLVYKDKNITFSHSYIIHGIIFTERTTKYYRDFIYILLLWLSN